MAKRKLPPPGTWLAEFRESAGLAPPPRTLSNAASRLVDLLDEFLYSLRCGWEIPPGFPRDRFVPTVYGKRDLVAPIVQYLIDLGFTGDARRLDEATRRFYAHRDWKLMTPRPGDDNGWKEFQQRYVNPLMHLAGCLQGVICEVRQLIIDMGSKGQNPKRLKRRRRQTDPKPLTPKQAEAVEAYAEFNGDIPKAAKRCGISPKAMRDRLTGAWKKIGERPVQNAMRAKTQRLPSDKRGQSVVFSNDETEYSDD
ncbi:MAG: hypothetical protein NXI32_14345 [bacterium]|nr:hypothetical protein [bacterium]